MILADKIALLRKRNGWSQEELAMRLNISRQSVSKWESAASVPDLDKIIKLSQIFGISTDSLLKDEIDLQEEMGTGAGYEAPAGGMEKKGETETSFFKDEARSVSMEEAEGFMAATYRTANKIAMGVSLCILSPVILILAAGLAQAGAIPMTEEMAGGFGTVVLLLMIAAGVGILIVYGMQLDRYRYFEEEAFCLDDGVAEAVERKKEAYEHTFRGSIAAGVILCIMSVVPLLIAAGFSSVDIVYIYCVALLLMMIALAVNIFIRTGMKMGCFQKILQEEDYTREKKSERRKTEPFSGIYWSLITAVYLGISFWTMNWGRTWIIWPCAGVLYAAVSGIIHMAGSGRCER